MLIVALAELAVIVALCVGAAWLIHRERRDANDLLHLALEQARTERRELTTRIQRPELVPATAPPVQRQPPRDAAALASIGTFAPRDDAA